MHLLFFCIHFEIYIYIYIYNLDCKTAAFTAFKAF